MHFLEPSDLAKVFRAAYAANTPKSRLHHLAMLTHFYSGTRVSQLLALTGGDVFQRDGQWVIMLPAAKHGKTAIRSLHMSDDPALDMSPLIALADTRKLSLLFGGLSRWYFNEVLEKYFTDAGIPRAFAHSHVFRHSAAMAIFKSTQRIGAVTEFLAHRSPASAFVYLQENDGQLAQDAMNQLILA